MHCGPARVQCQNHVLHLKEITHYWQGRVAQVSSCMWLRQMHTQAQSLVSAVVLDRILLGHEVIIP